MQESFQRLQQLLEVAATVGSYGHCWKLRRLLEARNITENALSILIVIFFCTTPTNRDLRQKAVYFPARAGSNSNTIIHGKK